MFTSCMWALIELHFVAVTPLAQGQRTEQHDLIAPVAAEVDGLKAFGSLRSDLAAMHLYRDDDARSLSGSAHDLGFGDTCAPPGCDDANPCTSDICSDGFCTHPSAPAGTACGSSSNTICDNPDTCSSGVCQVNNEPYGTPCTSDSNPSTLDICSAGICTHLLICNNNGVCDSAENCNNCSNDCEAGPLCGNGICEIGSFAGAENCQTCPQDCGGSGGASTCCGKGSNPTCGIANCTVGDFECSPTPACCGNGICEGTENETNCAFDCCATDCSDGNACTDDACVPIGECEHIPLNCNDGDDCTADSCDPLIGCTHELVLLCDDRDPCNGIEFCVQALYCETVPFEDCNGNGILDVCDVAQRISADCNGNEIPDECEPDCNVNAQPDSCDLSAGTSPDCNGNGIPDECEPDCNANDVADSCDLESGTSLDCDANAVPDECQEDLDGDGVIDACDGCPDDPLKAMAGICGCGVLDVDNDADGIADCLDQCPGYDDGIDCNFNGIVDGCEVAGRLAMDCNVNGIPDDCDLTSGTSADCNLNQTPDSCDIASGFSQDCDDSLVPDDCEVLYFVASSGELGPLGQGSSQSHTFNAPPLAGGEVLLTFTARADLGATVEFVTVFLNGQQVGVVFDTQANDCPATPNIDVLALTAGGYNQAMSWTGVALIDMIPSATVDPALCESFISVALGYQAIVPGDCNGSGLPDLCDISAGTSTDCDANGVPDECGGVCDDSNPCTIDMCEPGTGCSYVPFACDDYDICTADSCDVVLGCLYSPINCNDNDACTIDSCDPVLGCVATTIDCDDGDPCTTELCDDREGCTYGPADCNDDDACTEDLCDPVLGCVNLPVNCKAQDDCTLAICVSELGCVYPPIVCDDSDACTTDDCGPGVGCFHTPISCDDEYLCTTDSCDPGIGCEFSPVQCPDGQVCDPETGLCAALCVTDLNGSGGTDAADLALLLGAWGPNPAHSADFNGDDAVNAADLAILLGNWGACE